MRRILALTCLVGLLSGTAFAQSADEGELASIRTDLGALNIQIESLRRELQATGSGGANIANAGPLLQRVDLLEQELRRLTGDVEQLQFRMQQIVDDGTRRIGDLEFRLIELEGGDVGQVGKTLPLGGEATTAPPPAQPSTGGAQAQVSISERGAFDAAFADYEAGNYAASAQQFQNFMSNYPGGPLNGTAAFWRGESLAQLGDWNNAARSYLDSFSGTPNGEKAPEALFRLGVSLARLGRVNEACQTLNEVGKRYPNLDPTVASGVATEKAGLSCS